MIKRLFFCLLVLGAFSLDSQSTDQVQLSLISESKTVGQEKTLLLGLRAQIAPGWKTYWRSPGVAGYGVHLTWEGSKNIKSAQILWPLPHRVHTDLGMVNGYEGDVILPISLEVEDPSQPVQARMQVDMLVCDEENCLPVMQTLTLDLPKGLKGEDSIDAPQIRQALSKVPFHENDTPLQIGDVEIVRGNNPSTIQVLLSKETGEFSETDLPDLFLEINGYFVDAPLLSLSKNRKSILYSAIVYPDANRIPTDLPNLTGMPVKLTVGFQKHGFEVNKTLKPQPLNLPLFIGMLLIAFIGGVILNIMPCVLPVLSLKILSVMRQGGRQKTYIRQEFMATVLGIVFSFLVLAIGGIALKASGHAVGWGVQFQEPIFIIGLISVLTVFSANLFGFFEFRLPAVFSSLGGVTSHRESLMGSFLEGSLVTILATPCTAPFVGTALAFSLSHGSLEMVSIFGMMGLGLAFPFLLIALFPSLAAKLPKPGLWMGRVKNGLGFLLLLTIVWLLSVLIAQISMSYAALVALLMGLVFLILGKARFSSKKRRRIIWLSVSVLIGWSFMIPSFFHPSKLAVIFKEDALWRPFEPDRIDEYVKAGKVVFVNVTADWCLTCQVNKYFVLKSKAVLEALTNKNVVAMEADWTNHDPKITAYLKSFNQYGIPFYAVYGRRTRTGVFLGQVLTPKKVLDALKAERCKN